MPVNELERDEKLSKQPHGLRLIHRLPLLQVRLQVAAIAVLHHNRNLHDDSARTGYGGVLRAVGARAILTVNSPFADCSQKLSIASTSIGW